VAVWALEELHWSDRRAAAMPLAKTRVMDFIVIDPPNYLFSTRSRLSAILVRVLGSVS
jgi:hypothetical protein